MNKEQIHIKYGKERGELPANAAWRIFQSRDSVYWACTGRGGRRSVKFFRQRQLINYHPLQGFEFNAFLEDTISGRVWIDDQQ